MARIDLGPTPGQDVEYVFQNFHNPDPDPVRAIIRAPRVADRRKLAAPTTGVAEDTFAFHERLVRALLVRIENYSVGGVPVVSADDLISRGDLAIFLELHTVLTDLLTLSPSSAKLFAGPFDSSPQAIRPSTGTAASADGVDSTSSATADQHERTQGSATPASAQA